MIIITKILNLQDLYHGLRVANLSTKLGIEINLPKNKIDHLYVSGILHDIGKAYVDQNIINKAGKLTEEERILIERHSFYSYKEVLKLGYPEDVAFNILYHHENWDGTGYPTGLKGSFIPIGSRILKIIDVFDALTMDRPYRKKLSVNDALMIMNKYNTTYDPELYLSFIKILNVHIEKISI